MCPDGRLFIILDSDCESEKGECKSDKDCCDGLTCDKGDEEINVDCKNGNVVVNNIIYTLSIPIFLLRKMTVH